MEAVAAAVVVEVGLACRVAEARGLGSRVTAGVVKAASVVVAVMVVEAMEVAEVALMAVALVEVARVMAVATLVLVASASAEASLGTVAVVQMVACCCRNGKPCTGQWVNRHGWCRDHEETCRNLQARWTPSSTCGLEHDRSLRNCCI